MIVVITVVQLHYCHTKFLEVSAIPDPPTDDISKASSVAYGTFAVNKSDDETEAEDVSDFLNEIKIRKLSKQEIRGAAMRLFNKLLVWLEIVVLFIEIHSYKIMLVATFVLAVRELRLLHFGFVVLGVAGLKAKTETQFTITRVASLIAGILLIVTMMYQVDYIDHNKYEANCTNETDPNSAVNNNAIWIGLRKATPERKLTNLLRPYLLYIMLVSAHSCLGLWQTIKRIKKNKPARTPTVVFKSIRRSDADRDIPHLIKYLINYGFYKFGIEICLMGYVLVVGARMDIVACCYATWMLFLYNLQREEARKVWSYATIFILVSIPVQYLSLIGLPPGLCWDYPWSSVKVLQDFNIFAFLPENTLAFKEKVKLLLLDFVLLLLMCRQLIVFRVEARYENSVVTYPGGTNTSVLPDIDSLGTVKFINPTHDYIDKIRNYLDIGKRFVFLLFFWAALAIVFLTGTSRVNILSIGYIAGSFIFLWQGTDFYLRPIYVIISWWNKLILYNISVVVIKSFLQFFGCIVLNMESVNSFCWLIQVRKRFYDNRPTTDRNFFTLNFDHFPSQQLLGATCICTKKQVDPTAQCNVPPEDSTLFWDGICFAFLIIQRRIFSSHYFCHVINEAKASLILASRGNELIEELRRKEMKVEADREAQVLQKIKSKMDRIKATQQRVLEENEPKHHAAGNFTEFRFTYS